MLVRMSTLSPSPVMFNQQLQSLLIDDLAPWLLYSANIRVAKEKGWWVGAAKDYCLFIRGLSFGEFSGCAYLRNDDNSLAIFCTLPPSAAREKERTATEICSDGLFMAVRLRCDKNRLCVHKKTKRKETKRKFE